MKVLKIPFSHKQDLPESIQEAMESIQKSQNNFATDLFFNIICFIIFQRQLLLSNILTDKIKTKDRH